MTAPDAGRPVASDVEKLTDALLFGANAGSVEAGRMFRESIARRLLKSGWLDAERAEARAAALREAADELRSHRLDLSHRPGAWLPEDEGYNAGIDHCVGFLADRIESAQGGRS